MENEIDIKIYIQDDGNMRITGYAGFTSGGLWNPIRISDDEWDKLILGNTKFVRELKKLVKSKAGERKLYEKLKRKYES